jgi:hypothetical protein
MNPNTPQPTVESHQLVDVVQRIVGTRVDQVHEWRSTPLTGGHTDARVYRLAGQAWPRYSPAGGGSGGRALPWSVVLKERAAPSPAAPSADERAPDYWRRETAAYESGLLSTLDAVPGGLVAARCFLVEEQAHGVRLWLEDLGAVDAHAGIEWPPAWFGAAARCLGRFNAAFAGPRSFPAFAWLSPGFLPGWLAFLGRSTLDTIDREPWQHPLKDMAMLGDVVQGVLQRPDTWAPASLRRAYPSPVAPRLLRLWTERDRLLERLARLPQALAHGDAKQHNLFARPTIVPTSRTAPSRGAGGVQRRPAGQDDEEAAQVVAIDWDFVGPQAVGEDAGHLLGNAIMHAQHSEEPRRLDDAIFRGYLAGLRASGWSGDERGVRFAYTAHAALFAAFEAGCDPVALTDERFRRWRFPDSADSAGTLDVPATAATAAPTATPTPQPELPLEEVIASRSFRTYALLDLADEALSLVRAL